MIEARASPNTNLMYIDIFCWNVRGFNKLAHRSGFKKWFFGNKPIFGGLLETHVKQPKNKKFIDDLLLGWSFEDNYEFSELGKIWILWHLSVKVNIISKSLQLVTCEVFLPSSPSSVVFSFVYAANVEELRKCLWEEIVLLSSDPRIVGKPWSVMGDFNQVLNPSEHSTSDGFNVDRATREFRESLLNEELMDLSFMGSTFTWWNKRQLSPITKKIDKILINDVWPVYFPSSVGFFGPPDFSDHASCGILLSPSIPRQKRAFRFFNVLLKDQVFLEEVFI